MQPIQSSAVGAVPPGAALVYVPVPIRSQIYDRYHHKQSILLGWTQIIICILCVLCNSICLGVSTYNGLGFIGHGYWCGILFLITGIFGVVAGKKKTKCQIVTFMVLCILSAAFTIVLLAIGIIGAGLTIRPSYYNCEDYQKDYEYAQINVFPCISMTTYNIVVAMESCLAILGFIEAIVAIWGSILCCCSGVCCCSSPMMAVPAVGYYSNTGQMIYMTQIQGGPNSYTPQPSSSYPQGMIPPSAAYMQPGGAMPTTNNGPAFDQAPPPYATSPEQSHWMIPPAITYPSPMAASAPTTDPFSSQTKDVLRAEKEPLV